MLFFTAHRCAPGIIDLLLQLLPTYLYTNADVMQSPIRQQNTADLLEIWGILCKTGIRMNIYTLRQAHRRTEETVQFVYHASLTV